MSTSSASIATGGGDEILLWRVPGDGTPTTTLPAQPGGVSCLAWSKSAQVLAASTYQGRIGIYSQSGALIDQMMSKDSATGQAEQLSTVACASQSLSIASGGQDRILKLWDCKKKEVVKTFKGHRAAITCCSFGDRDSYIVSGSKGGDLLVHNTSSSAAPQKLKVGETQGVGIAINVVQFSPFRRTVAAAAGEEAVVQLYDTVKGSEPISQFKQHKGSVTGLAFSPVNELLLCTAGLDRSILFFDVQANKLVKSLTCDAPLRSLDFMNDGFTVAAGAGNGQVMVYDLRALGAGATPFMVFEAHKRNPVSCVQFQHAANKSSAKPKTSLGGKENSAPRSTTAPPPLAPSARKDSIGSRDSTSSAPGSSRPGKIERSVDMPSKRSTPPPEPPQSALPSDSSGQQRAQGGSAVGRRSPSTASPSPAEAAAGGSAASVEELLKASQKRVEERLAAQHSQPQSQTASPAAAAPPALVASGSVSVQQRARSELLSDVERIQRERAGRASVDSLATGALKGGGGDAAAMIAARQARSSVDSPLAAAGKGKPAESVFSPLPARPPTEIHPAASVRDSSSFSAVREALADAHDHKASPAGSLGGATTQGSNTDLPPPPARRSSSNFPPPSPSVAGAGAAGLREGSGSRESSVEPQSKISPQQMMRERQRIPDELIPAVAAVVQDTVNEIRDAMKQDMENMHLDMLRQFHMQQTETRRIMQEFGRQNTELNAEVRRLREEVMRLRNVY